MAESVEKKYSNPRSSKIREFIRIHFLSSPFFQTKSANEKVLDLGCGWGFYFKINPNAYGIDFDENCLKYLRSLRYKVVKGDIRKRFPFKDNFFRWVIAHDVLEHFQLEKTKKIFEEVYRVLQIGGNFLILVPNKKGFDFGRRLNRGHKHFITPKEIIFITRNNFSLQKHFPYPFPRVIGSHFTHNKEVLILKKINAEQPPRISDSS